MFSAFASKTPTAPPNSPTPGGWDALLLKTGLLFFKLVETAVPGGKVRFRSTCATTAARRFFFKPPLTSAD
jgi:hypothetical protein